MSTIISLSDFLKTVIALFYGGVIFYSDCTKNPAGLNPDRLGSSERSARSLAGFGESTPGTEKKKGEGRGDKKGEKDEGRGKGQDSMPAFLCPLQAVLLYL